MRTANDFSLSHCGECAVESERGGEFSFAPGACFVNGLLLACNRQACALSIEDLHPPVAFGALDRCAIGLYRAGHATKVETLK
jgi:hypothetical protein